MLQRIHDCWVLVLVRFYLPFKNPTRAPRGACERIITETCVESLIGTKPLGNRPNKLDFTTAPQIMKSFRTITDILVLPRDSDLAITPRCNRTVGIILDC